MLTKRFRDAFEKIIAYLDKNIGFVYNLVTANIRRITFKKKRRVEFNQNLTEKYKYNFTM